MNLTEVTDLTSIGTLFAFVLVSGGILILNPKGNRERNRNGFVVPYFNSRYFLPPFAAGVAALVWLSGTGMGNFRFFSEFSVHSLPYLIFTVTAVVVIVFAVMKSWSFIPVLGLLTNFYLMSELGVTNWSRFGVWLVFGLVIYFSYGIFNSKLSVSVENS
jgi:hypothetical protein